MRAVTLAALTLMLACNDPSGGNDPDATDTAFDTALDPSPDGDLDTTADPAPDVDPDGDAPADTPADGDCTSDGDCDDADPCTTDVCDTDYGSCSHDPVDGDGDGYAAAAVGATDCDGTDCDDDDATIYPDSAVRVCMADGDCNGNLDSDNDGDGSDSETCSGNDCDDEQATVHPGATPGCGTTVGDPLSDLDCNGNLDSDNDGDLHLSDACPGLSGDDCDDASADIHAGAEEICADGVNQDCDGWTDGPAVRFSEVLVTDGSQAGIAWNGNKVSVTWRNPDPAVEDLFYWTVPLTGPDGSRTIRVTTGSMGAYDPAMAFTGSQVALAWSDTRNTFKDVYVRILAPGGAFSTSEIRVTQATADTESPALAFSGSELGVAWQDSKDGNWEIYFTRMAMDGTEMTSDTRITNDAQFSNTPSLAWSGSEYGLAWYDGRDTPAQVYFARIAADGTKVGSDIRITDTAGGADHPSMAWTGSEYGVAFLGAISGEVDLYLARVAPDGTRIGTDARVAGGAFGAFFPDLEWANGAFHLAWADPRNGNKEIYYARLDPEGTMTSSEIRISEGIQESTMPAITWTGSEIVVFWDDFRNGTTPQLYMSIIDFCQ